MLLVSGSDFCREPNHVELLSPYYVLLFIGEVCGNYSVVVHLPVKMYKRVKYENVYSYEWYLSTYILVCLLAGAGVMPGGHCVVFCVKALLQPLL